MTTDEMILVLSEEPEYGDVWIDFEHISKIIDKLRSQEAQIKGLQYDLRQAVESDILNRSEALSRIGHMGAQLAESERLSQARMDQLDVMFEQGIKMEAKLRAADDLIRYCTFYESENKGLMNMVQGFQDCPHNYVWFGTLNCSACGKRLRADGKGE